MFVPRLICDELKWVDLFYYICFCESQLILSETIVTTWCSLEIDGTQGTQPEWYPGITHYKVGPNNTTRDHCWCSYSMCNLFNFSLMMYSLSWIVKFLSRRHWEVKFFLPHRQPPNLKQLIHNNILPNMDMDSGTKACTKPRSQFPPYIYSNNNRQILFI